MPCRSCHSPRATPLERAVVHVSRRTFQAGDALCSVCSRDSDDLTPPADTAPSFAVAESIARELGLTVETERVQKAWLGVPQCWWAFAGELEACGDTEEEACAGLVVELRRAENAGSQGSVEAP